MTEDRLSARRVREEMTFLSGFSSERVGYRSHGKMVNIVMKIAGRTSKAH